MLKPYLSLFLIIPDDGTFDLHYLENMVKEVNETAVDPADKLTDSVYHYDSRDKIFELGEKFVERQQNLEKAEAKEAEAGEKKSLFGELKTAKEEASKKPARDAHEKEHKDKGGNAI